MKNAIRVVRIFPNEPDGLKQLASVNGLICLGKFSKKKLYTFLGICSNIVFLDMVVNEYNITSLTLDFERAVYDVMDYLTGLGHTKIALLVGCEYVGDGGTVLLTQELLLIRNTWNTGKWMPRHMCGKAASLPNPAMI